MKNKTLAELEKDLAPGRLVTLCDGRKGIRGAMQVQIADCKMQNGEPVLDFVASDETVDRYDEVIAADGWQLDNYQKNPVFQNSHRYGDIAFTLGKARVTAVKDGKLYQRIEFATEANPMADIAYKLYRGGFLNAVSVGFIPLSWLPGEPGSGVARRYTKQELLEVSAVSIPANPNALVVGLKAGAISRSDLNDLVEMLECAVRAYSQTWAKGIEEEEEEEEDSKKILQQTGDPNGHARDSAAGVHQSQLLQLTKGLGKILKL